jgi:hypothetical protein
LTRPSRDRFTADISDGGLEVAVDVEDGSMEGENTDFDKVEFDHLGRNRRGEDKGKNRIDNEFFRGAQKWKLRAAATRRLSHGLVPFVWETQMGWEG